MPQVPTAKTPLTLDELAKVLQAEAEKLGITDALTLAMLGGLVGLECAQGKAINNHNWGNVMASRDWINAGKPFWGRPHQDGNQPQAFRAYPTHAEGAAAWLRLLTTGRHRPALDFARLGDAQGMADSLFRTSYIVPVRLSGSKPVEQQKAEYAAGIRSIAQKLLDRQAFGNSSKRLTESSVRIVPGGKFERELNAAVFTQAMMLFGPLALVGLFLRLKKGKR